MKKTSAKIVFFGNERIATGVTTTAPVLTALIDAGYDITAVVSHHTSGQSRNTRTLEIAEIAQKHDIPLLLPDRPKDIFETLRATQSDIGVLVAYGKIVPPAIIDLFPRGIINIHPSLLPLHRGPTPLESVLLSSEPLTGVSVMALAKEMDAGDIYAQSEYNISLEESKQDLADSLLDIGSAMVVDLLPGILDGTIVGMPQDHSKATYDTLITKDRGVLDFTKPASQLVREICAYQGWPGSQTKLGGMDVTITAAQAEAIDFGQPGEIDTARLAQKPGELVIQCGEGSLRVEQLKPANKKEMPSNAFLQGYRTKLLT